MKPTLECAPASPLPYLAMESTSVELLMEDERVIVTQEAPLGELFPGSSSRNTALITPRTQDIGLARQRRWAVVFIGRECPPNDVRLSFRSARELFAP